MPGSGQVRGASVAVLPGADVQGMRPLVALLAGPTHLQFAGLRLSEQFRARWDCVDLEQGILTVPLSKSGRTRHVLLSDAAVSIVRRSIFMARQSIPFPKSTNLCTTYSGTEFRGQGLHAGA